MKRTPLVRRTPLKAKAGLEPGPGPERKVPIRKVNRRRKAVLFEGQFGSVARVRWFQMQECVACGGWPSECAHVRSRGAGGTAEHIIPLCRACHRKQHDEGWAALPITDPAALARDYDERWRKVEAA